MTRLLISAPLDVKCAQWVRFMALCDPVILPIRSMNSDRMESSSTWNCESVLTLMARSSAVSWNTCSETHTRTLRMRPALMAGSVLFLAVVVAFFRQGCFWEDITLKVDGEDTPVGAFVPSGNDWVFIATPALGREN